MSLPLTTSEIASLVNGELVGRGDITIQTLSPLDEMQPCALGFLKEFGRKKIEEVARTTKLSALLVSNKAPRELLSHHIAWILVSDPLRALVSLIPHFFAPRISPSGISDKADIHPTATISHSAKIGAFVSIGRDCFIGEGTVIHPHVVVYEGVRVGEGCEVHSGVVIREHCKIGPRTILQNGAIIGADGFGYVGASDGKGPPQITKVPQVGNVELSNDVEIGANTCIDRATLGSTRVGPHTKIDNLVQIGHNVKIGAFSILCGEVGVAGSTSIGNGVVLGGGVGVKDHAMIADGVRVAAHSGVTGDLLKKGDYAGMPAIPVFQWRKQAWAIQKLPSLLKEMKGGLKESLTDESSET